MPAYYKIKIKQTVNNSIILGIAAGVLGILSVIRSLNFIMIACSIIGLSGAYLTFKRMKSGAFVFMFAALITVIMKPYNSSNIYPVIGFCYAVASMNNFSLINLGSPALNGNENLSDIKNMQAVWFKKINEFISSYSIFAYYGYLFIIFMCMALSGVRILAPEIIYGHSREYWALLGSAGLVSVAGLVTENMRRKIEK